MSRKWFSLNIYVENDLLPYQPYENNNNSKVINRL